MKRILLCAVTWLCVSTTLIASAETTSVTTSIRASQCGTTLASISTLISAVCTPQATIYRFEISNTRNNVVQTLDRTSHYFSLSMLPSYDYATTYSIRILLQINGVWQDNFGPECFVSSPDILGPNGAAQIVSSQCNTYVENINKLIATNSLPGVTKYRFRITNHDDTDPDTQVQLIDRQYAWFSLTMLHKYNYGARYTVEVAVKTNGDFSDFGAPCIVGAPEVPILVACGSSIPDAATPIATTSLSKVTTYRFEVTDLNTLVSTTIDRPFNWFTFNNIPTYNPTTSYGVRIALLTNGSYSDYGDACEIFPPQNSRAATDIKSETSKTNLMQAYPNPFTDSFRINTTFSAAYDIDINTFDMTGRLLERIHLHPGELDKIELGQNYPTGVYSVIIYAGKEKETLKVIKR